MKRFAAAVLACITLFAASGCSDKTNTETRVYENSLTDNSGQTADSSAQDNSETDEPFDTSKISAAYLSGDTSELSDFEKQIYDKALSVLDETVADSMSDYEKELAVHDWLITNCRYDKKALGVFKTPSENADNPYGALINGQAICSGYSGSFQMFMDMLGIPCKTIHASAHGGDEHAWNMVCLDDEWYYVDVTWDDPTPDSEGAYLVHDYFNVTDEVMLQDHEWDTSQLPKAESLKYSYVSQNVVEVSDYKSLRKAVLQAAENGSRHAYVMFTDKSGVDMNDIDPLVDYDENSAFYKKYISRLENERAFDFYWFDTVQAEQGTCIDIEFEINGG